MFISLVMFLYYIYLSVLLIVYFFLYSIYLTKYYHYSIIHTALNINYLGEMNMNSKRAPTSEEILLSLSNTHANNKVIDLGTEICNRNRNLNRNQNKNMNTFQQSTRSSTSDYVNVGEASPPAFASQASSRPGSGRKYQEKPEVLAERKLGKNDVYEEIHIQVNKLQIGDRHSRAKVYVSLKRDNDINFSTFLSGSVTSALYETIATANEKKEYNIIKLIQSLKDKYGDNDLVVGRLKYKPRNNFKTDMHRSIIPHVLIAIYRDEYDNIQCCLYILNEKFECVMNTNDELKGKQKQYYDMVGIYRGKPQVMSEDDAFTD